MKNIRNYWWELKNRYGMGEKMNSKNDDHLKLERESYTILEKLIIRKQKDR